MVRRGPPAAIAAITAAFGLWAFGLPPLAQENPDSQSESKQEDEPEQALFRGMPADEGRLEVFGFCASCHSIDLVLQQGLSRTVWEEVLEDMVDEHQMVPLRPEIRAKVLDYLEKHYGPDRRARKRKDE